MEIRMNTRITDKKEVAGLLQRYVDVCNRALMFNKDRFPFKQILCGAQAEEAGKKIEVTISDLSAIPSFVFEIEKGQILLKDHGNCVDCNCDRKWSVPVEYLKKIAETPDMYVQNPAKIDWEWMYPEAQSADYS